MVADFPFAASNVSNSLFGGILNNFASRPLYVGCLYLLLIPVFGNIYYWNPSFWERQLTPVESGYFSVVTITTLGYGDIVPKTEVARFLTAVESILGILTIGLFLNAVAQSAERRREERHKSTTKEHLRAQYHQWREDLVRACIRAYDESYAIDSELEKKLVDFREFRSFFMGKERKRWSSVLGGIQADEKIIGDIFVISELFSQQINAALGNIYTSNSAGLATLTRVAQHPRLLQRLDLYSGDPVKYIGQYLLEVLAMWGSVSGKMESDFIEDAIQNL